MAVPTEKTKPEPTEFSSRTPPLDPMVYIAYGVEDGTKFVNHLVNRLTKQGFNVWEFRRRGSVGPNWHDATNEALTSSFAFIVVLTESSLRSENVLYETQTAYKHQLPLIVLRLRNTFPDTELISLLKSVENFDFEDSAESSWSQLVDVLKQHYLRRTKRTPDMPDTIPWRIYNTHEGANNDEVPQQDQLEFQHYVNAFVKLIRSPYASPPLTIGIYGSWGMGKSFLLEKIVEMLNGGSAKKSRPKLPQSYRLRPFIYFRHNFRDFLKGIQDGLSKWFEQVFLHRWRRVRRHIRANWFFEELPPVEPRIHIVEFNAWEYSANEIIWPGLVRKIMDKLEKETSWGFPGLFFTKVWRNLTSQAKGARGTWLVIAALSIIAIVGLMFALQNSLLVIDTRILQGAALLIGTGGIITIFKVIYDAIKPMGTWVTQLVQNRDYGKQIGYMEEIRSDLEFLERQLHKNNGRILVVIDDLDRCEPEKAVEMLQAIKLLLNFKSFIVILGIDARIITGAVEKHYQGLLKSSGASGYEYLDKIIQIPFRIPEPTPSEIHQFIVKQITQPKVEIDEQPSITNGKGAVAPPTNGASRKPDSSAQQPTPTIPGQPPNLLVFDDSDPVTNVDFNPEEQRAFEAMADYLRPNPRHIKRIINVYRLVRALAESKQEVDSNYKAKLLKDRDAAIRWLVICGQWPYTTYMIVQEFEKGLKKSADGGWTYEMPKAVQSAGDLITNLYQGVKNTPKFDPRQQKRLDYDAEKLIQFLRAAPENWMDWEELLELRRYTINFNPAIESELEAEAEKKEKQN
ncbi:MAG: TIR domain-containing protein [Anaerolineae bacterium]|nr:TIR domain-containing protein [Anaerolineae bacterium]